MQVSQRLAQYLERSLPKDLSADLIASLECFDETNVDGQDAERVGAAIAILVGRGVVSEDVIGLAQRDWRDLLMASGLGGDDWRDTLTTYLDSGGSATPNP